MQSIFLLCLALLLSLSSTAFAQENPKLAQPLSDDSEFRALHNPVISVDGTWMAAEEHSDRGDGAVRVWSTEGDVNYTIERGQNPRISADSRWVSALQKPPREDSQTAMPKNKRAGQTLVLLDTQDGSRKTFDFVLSYDMTYCSLYLFYLQSPETKPAAGTRSVGTLQLLHLESDFQLITMESVAHYAVHPTMNYVACVLHDEEASREALHVIGFSPKNIGINAKIGGEKIEGLRWARDRRLLGFLDSKGTTGKDGKRRVDSALYTWQRDVDNPHWETIVTRVDTSK